jgi:hypothetical protein
MHAIGLRRTAALLVALLLLAAAAPAAAAPERAAGEPGIGPSLFHALTAWLADLWPGSGLVSAPAPACASSGAETSAEPQLGGEIDPNCGPTVEPQLGCEIDPNG